MASGPEIVVREARDGDSAGVIDLIARVFAEYPGCILDVDREEPQLRSPASSFDRFFVVERAGEVVGCGGLSEKAGGVVELKKLYLDSSVRGLGLARDLTERIERHAMGIGSERVDLWSDTRFIAAHGFYERMGYRRTGRTRELHDLSKTTEYEFAKEFHTRRKRDGGVGTR